MSSFIDQIQAKLYTTNEYGFKHQTLDQKLLPGEVDYMVKHYGVRTRYVNPETGQQYDIHSMCINCQSRQLIKYSNFKDKTGKSVEGFKVDCKFVPANLPPGSKSMFKKYLKHSGAKAEDALLALKSTIDPVSWIYYMFGFRDNDPNWRLRPYQKEQIRCSSKRLVIREGRRAGKALALDTPIPSPSGWTTMGALDIGDIVFDEEGNPTTVTSTTEVMYNHRCYEVHFDDGSVIVADAEHRWAVETKDSRTKASAEGEIFGATVVMTTEEMIPGLIAANGVKNYSIPIAKPLAYETDQELTLDPYELGYWLSRKNPKKPLISKENPHTLMCRRIPREYLEASYDVRLALLQGLMDGSGGTIPTGRCEFVVADASDLADDFYELVTGLGIKVAKTISPRYINGIRYSDRIRFQFDTSLPVFKLKKKKAEKKRDQLIPSNVRRSIVDIKRVKSVPVKCITVDSPNSLYLAGEACIPTHNTFSMALKLIYLAFNYLKKMGNDADGNPVVVGPEIIIITPYQAQISNIFDEMERILKRNPELIKSITTNKGGTLYIKTPNYKIKFENGAEISGFVSGVGAKEDGSAGGTIRGQSADVIYLDEMDMIPEEILSKVIMPLLLTNENVMMIATSTPIGKRGAFYNWSLARPDFKEDYLPSTVLPQWEKIKHEVEAENTKDGFNAEYMAHFIEGGYGVFKPEYVYRARGAYSYRDSDINNGSWWRDCARVSNRADLIKVIGIDWNKNAGSEFVVVAYDPNQHHWWVVEATNISAGEYSSVSFKEEVVRLNYKWKPDYIYADEGWGHHIIEDLKVESHAMMLKKNRTKLESQTAKIKDRLKAFNFSSKVTLKSPVDGTDISKSGKEFLVENSVRVFEEGRIWFPEDDKVLLDQLLNYVVLRRHPSNNKPIYGADRDSIGDHRLDGLMLALGGLFLEKSMYSPAGLPSSVPSSLTKEVLSQRAEKLNKRINAADVVRAIQGAAPAVHATVLEIIRGGSAEEDEHVRSLLRAQEELDKGSSGYFRSGPPRSRGDLTREGVGDSILYNAWSNAQSSAGYSTDTEALHQVRRRGASRPLVAKRRTSGSRRGWSK